MYDFDISMINFGPNKIKWFGWTVCFYFSRLGHGIWYGCIWSIIDVKYRYGTAHLRYDTNTTRYLVCRFTTIRKQQIHRNTAILHISLILSPSFSITILWYHPDFESSFFCSMPHKPFFCDYQRFMSFASSQLNAFYTMCISVIWNDWALNRMWKQMDGQTTIESTNIRTYISATIEPASESRRFRVQSNFSYLNVTLKSINHRNLFRPLEKTNSSTLWPPLLPFTQMNKWKRH